MKNNRFIIVIICVFISNYVLSQRSPYIGINYGYKLNSKNALTKFEIGNSIGKINFSISSIFSSTYSPPILKNESITILSDGDFIDQILLIYGGVLYKYNATNKVNIIFGLGIGMNFSMYNKLEYYSVMQRVIDFKYSRYRMANFSMPIQGGISIQLFDYMKIKTDLIIRYEYVNELGHLSMIGVYLNWNR